jgi:membrane protein implicated in regulation of membrane protease activity
MSELSTRFYQGEGTIDSVSKPGIEWIVRINGVYWKARSAVSGVQFRVGDLVKPISRQGNKLLIVEASAILS